MGVYSAKERGKAERAALLRTLKDISPLAVAFLFLTVCGLAVQRLLDLELVRWENPFRARPTLESSANVGLDLRGLVRQKQVTRSLGRLPTTVTLSATLPSTEQPAQALPTAAASVPGDPATTALSLKDAVNNALGTKQAIVVATVSKKYLDFLENWLESVARTGHDSEVLFVAEDDVAYEYMKKKWPLRTVNGTQVVADRPLYEEAAKDVGFASNYFNSLMDRRSAYFLAFIELGVSFLYNDVDIVWLKDPFPYFVGDYDMWMQEDTHFFTHIEERFAGDRCAAPIKDIHDHSLCTCFMYVRPTPQSKLMVQLWDKNISGAAEPVADMPFFNYVYYTLPDDAIKIAVLPVAKFPAGCLYFAAECPFYLGHQTFPRANKHWRKDVVVVHNNYIIGHTAKLNRFVMNGLWHSTPATNNSKVVLEQMELHEKADITPWTPKPPPPPTLLEAAKVALGGNDSVVVATVTKQYIDFMENWFASVERIGYGERVLFIAEDDEAFDYMRKKWPSRTVNGTKIVEDRPLHNEGGGAAMGFASNFFNSLMDRRSAYFMALLNINVTFLYNDVDIVWLKDPFPYFSGDNDIWMSEDTHFFTGIEERFAGDRCAQPIRDIHDHALCTCFIMVRPTEVAKKLVALWDKNLTSSATPIADMPAFNLVYYDMPENVSIGVLPIYKFPSGCLYFSGDCPYYKGHQTYPKKHPKWRDEVVVVHNNYIVGGSAKRDRFKENFLWGGLPDKSNPEVQRLEAFHEAADVLPWTPHNITVPTHGGKLQWAP